MGGIIRAHVVAARIIRDVALVIDDLERRPTVLTGRRESQALMQ